MCFQVIYTYMKTKICVHKDHVGNRELPISEFRNHARSKDGKAAQCKDCADRLTKASHAKRPGHKYQVSKQRRKNLLEDLRTYKSNKGCMCCDETTAICLELHHLVPEEKELHPADMIARGWAWERMMIEVAKCEVLCSNCHKKVHADLINLDDYK